MSTFAEELERGADELGLEVSQEARSALGLHYAEMVKWNRTHNLTRVEDVREAVRVHYLDCLAGIQCLRQWAGSIGPFVDLGSGAGFPGFVLGAVGEAGTLVDAARKRCSFLERTVRAAGLRMVSVRHARAEDISDEDLVVSRATFSDGKWGVARDCVAPGGVLAIWGSAEMEPKWRSSCDWEIDVLRYEVPGLERRLLLARRPIHD